MMSESNHVKSFSSVIIIHISVMLFGLSSVLGQFANLPSPLIAGGRVICSSIALLIFSLITKSDLKLRRKKDYILVLVTGVILAVHWTTFFQSIQCSSVAIGTITFSAFPLFLTFLEPIVFHEKPKLFHVICSILLLLGVGIMVPEFSFSNSAAQGVLWGLLSALSYGIMTLFNRYFSASYPARTICLYEQGTAAVVLLPFFFFMEASWSPQNIAAVAAIGLLCTALAHSLYVAAQKFVSAQMAGILSGMESVYGILFAMLLLKEFPNLREVIGGVMILCVSLLVSLSSVRKSNSPKTEKTAT